jgi:hypothetical protein
MSTTRLVGHTCRTALLATMVALGVVAAQGAAPAFADTTIHVTWQKDEEDVDGQCSLTEAIVFTKGTLESDCALALASGRTTIVVPPGCYRVSARLQPEGKTEIDGAGPGPASCAGGGTVIQQLQHDWVVYNRSGSETTIAGVTLTGGGGGSGGAIANSATLALNNVLITGNAAFDGGDGMRGGDGGGILNNAGASLTVTDSTISGNSAGSGGNGSTASGGIGGDGGGIYNDGGRITIIGSTISGNSAGSGGKGAFGLSGTDGGFGGNGGGIFNADGSRLVIERSTIKDNRAGGGGAGGDGDAGGNGGGGGLGGGISSTGQLAIDASTLSGNTAGAGGAGGNGIGLARLGGNGGPGGHGGGIWSSGATASISDVTVSENAAGMGGSGGQGSRVGDPGLAGAGGGLFAQSPVALRSSTIAGNAAARGGGIFAIGAATVSEAASVISGNGGQNCSGAFADDGDNVAPADGTCPGANVDPQLAPLADNGGPTQTMALLHGSRAIDLVPTGTNCPQADQRGVGRPRGAACDAGAYEVAPPGVTNASARASAATGAALSATINSNVQATKVQVRYGTTTASGSTTAARDAGAGDSPVDIALSLSGLTPRTTYHAQIVATNGDGTTNSGDLTFTTAALSVAAPLLSQVRESARRWLEGTAAARISAKRRLPVGTTFSFALNERATVGFAFTQPQRGRRVRGHCVALTRRNARNRSCRRTVVRGILALGAHQGADQVRFQGMLGRGRRLRPGTYATSITATDAAGRRSAPSRLSFTIVRRTR